MIDSVEYVFRVKLVDRDEATYFIQFYDFSSPGWVAITTLTNIIHMFNKDFVESFSVEIRPKTDKVRRLDL